MTTPTEAVEVLNRIHTADPTVLPNLIAWRVPCNETLADDPTVQVGPMPYSNTDVDQMYVGLLGVINGIFGVVPFSTHGYIAAHYDEDRVLTHFSVLS